MENTPHSQSIAEALDQLLLAIPEVGDLRTGYRSVACHPESERRAWIQKNTPQSMVDELREACHLPEPDSEDADPIYAVIESLVSSEDDDGAPGVIRRLLGTGVFPGELPGGIPCLHAVIHQFTDLDDLFEEIRCQHQQLFPPIRFRPSTVDDIAFVMPFFAQKMPMTRIAWELVYRDYPHVRTLDAAQRKAEYGDLHKKAYNRVRWLKSHAIERVSEMLPENSQDSG